MKSIYISSKWLKLTLISLASIGLFSQSKKSLANNFTEQEIDQQQIITVANPFGYKEYKLEIIEQIPNQQQCWNESGTSPVKVNLLLLNFDHTDSCKRTKDSNGYSIRIDGNDEKSSLYLIKVLQRNGELQVVAKHENPNLPELIIGRSKGLGKGALKIDLEPGWKITKRGYQDKTLGHVYLSGDSKAMAGNQNGDTSREGLPQPSTEVAGTFQIFQSNLAGCKPGNYRVSGQFDPSLTQLTIDQATGAEGCFDSLPTQIFNTPGLLDNGQPVDFISNAAPGMGQMNGSVRRVHGSFTTPVTYANAQDTIGFLAVNSNNIVVKDPTEETLNENTTIIRDIPAPPEMPISQVLPDLIPAASGEDKQTKDDRPDSDTNGLIIVRDKIRIVFDDEATVEEVNTAIGAIGGGISGSFDGGTAVTVKIPDTGDLAGVENAENILSTQPSVITTIPVIIDEVPELPTIGLPLTPPTTPCPIVPTPPIPGTSPPPIPLVQRQENIPMYLQVTGAVDSTGARPQPLGANPPNIFIMDWFSNPNHDDVNLVNPIHKVSKGASPIIVQNKLKNESLTARSNLKSYLCDKLGIGCPEKVNKRTPSDTTPLDPNKDENVALFSGDDSDQFEKDGVTPNNHGFLVSGITAARDNTCGVVGMYPANDNTKILAFNALGENRNLTLLHTLQRVEGQHIVNYSGGLSKPKEDISLKEGLWWMTQIRQRKLEDRVVLVQAAGNDGTKGVKAEDNGTWSAAGLKDLSKEEFIDKKEKHCSTFLKINCKEKIIKRTIVQQFPRLENVLIVEALDAVTGDYANYSNKITNKDLAVRAFGEASDPSCGANLFPALTSNNGVICRKNGGTSSAAPQVAGLAAWLWSRESNLTASDVVNRIRNNQTEFQRLDSSGSFATDPSSSGDPLMSTQTAINVAETLRTPGLSLGSCQDKRLGIINISTSFESEESIDDDISSIFIGGTSTQYEINGDGIVRPGTNSAVNIKPALEEFGFDPSEFLSGEYGEEFIDVDYDFNGTVESIRLEKIPESCS